MGKDFKERQSELDRRIGLSHCFDIKKRPLRIGGREAFFTYVIGYTDGIMTERILSALQQAPNNATPQAIMEESLSFASAEITTDVAVAADEILRGSACLILDGTEDILIMDARSFSMRSTEEPEKDRTLRGPHVGFNESLISNLVQIRRYLRCADFATERFFLGDKIRNEVALIYLAGRPDEEYLEKLRSKLKNASLPALSMTQETLANLLFPASGLQHLNPFPKVRYTERPDVVAATLMEGKVAILCDNSPSVILLPECIFDFFEEADDYYFPPSTATYLRVVRTLVFLASVFLIPIWLAAVKYSENVPAFLQFAVKAKSGAVPLFLQFLIIEVALDGLKMASLNTPGTLSNSFSVIGGLLLGEFAVKSGWFVPETILYSAFTGIANYVPTNYELGYSFKFMRMSLILAVELFGMWGLVGGTLIWVGILASTSGIAGKGYLYPFLPFDRNGISRLLIRHVKGKETNAL